MKGDPRIVVTRHRRGRWSARVTVGIVEYRRWDGGPYAFTQRRAEAKGQRLYRAVARAANLEQHEVMPEAAS
jgi:hypothetical protein